MLAWSTRRWPRSLKMSRCSLDHATPGMGLGLAIAKAAVEAQGGHLLVEDSALGGVSFVLVIPNALDGSSRA